MPGGGLHPGLPRTSPTNFYQTELQETLPQLDTLDTQSLSMAIAESPYAAAVDETFGPQLRRLLTLDQRLHTGGKELQARISG